MHRLLRLFSIRLRLRSWAEAWRLTPVGRRIRRRMIRYGSFITGLRRAKSRRILLISRWICGNTAKRMNSVVAISATLPYRLVADSYRRFDGTAGIRKNFGRKHSSVWRLWRSEMGRRIDEIRLAMPV